MTKFSDKTFFTFGLITDDYQGLCVPSFVGMTKFSDKTFFTFGLITEAFQG